MVSVHGGPTSERDLEWEAQAQYFVSRGWHYLEVNHRGGTGFGRAYQDMLNGQWGIVDVQDARSGAEHLVAAGLADPLRLVITGHSAGGYTTMMALATDPDFWTAGVALSGISHMYDAAHGAHRFEVNYENTIVGPLPETGPRWMERSPLAHVKNRAQADLAVSRRQGQSGAHPPIDRLCRSGAAQWGHGRAGDIRGRGPQLCARSQPADGV